MKNEQHISVINMRQGCYVDKERHRETEDENAEILRKKRDD